MNIKNHKLIGLMFGVLLVTACGGGSDGAPPVARLQGDWYGAFIDSPGLYTLSLTVDAAGNISNVKVDGEPTGDTGTITQTGDNTFGYTLSDGSTGGFMADSAGNHLGMLDDDRNYGVLQKNASGFPTYALSDIGGTWSGYSVELDAGLNITRTYSSSATVNGTNGVITGSNPDGSFNGNFKLLYEYGYWTGTWSGGGNGGNVLAWLSPDKTFAASWACDYSSASEFDIYYITGCSFSMWNK